RTGQREGGDENAEPETSRQVRSDHGCSPRRVLDRVAVKSVKDMARERAKANDRESKRFHGLNAYRRAAQSATRPIMAGTWSGSSANSASSDSLSTPLSRSMRRRARARPVRASYSEAIRAVRSGATKFG